MRDVKFRIWDDNYKYMNNKVLMGMWGKDVLDEDNYTACSMWIDPKNVDYKCEPHWCHFEPYHKEIKLMQYTGLKDNNGTEIYEGDIVQCNGNKEDLHEIKFGKFPLRDFDTDEIVDFVTGWYFIILENDKFSKVEPLCYPTALNGYWINKIDVKVVGNIYENKELLKR